MISFVFSGIASVVSLWWLAGYSKYLAGNIKRAFRTDITGRSNAGDTQAVLLLLALAGLLFFAWCAPIVQYFRLRSKPRDEEHRTS